MKNIIVTGTSKGIGRAICDRFIDQGHRVIEITRGDSILVNKLQENQIVIKFDWKNFDELSARLKETINAKIDIVINNAGYLKSEQLLEVSRAEFEKHMEVNVWYPLELCRQLINDDILSETAHILNIGSVGGVQGSQKFKGLFSYSTSKGAMETLTEFMDVEWGAKGKSFNYLALGAVNTEMLREAFPGYISEVNPTNMAESICGLAMSFGQNGSGKIIQLSKSDPEA